MECAMFRYEVIVSYLILSILSYLFKLSSVLNNRNQNQCSDSIMNTAFMASGTIHIYLS